MIKKILIATAFTALVTTASAKEYTYEEFKAMPINDFKNVSADEIAPLCNRELVLGELRRADKDTAETRKEADQVFLKISKVENGYQTCDLLKKKHGYKPWMKDDEKSPKNETAEGTTSRLSSLP